MSFVISLFDLKRKIENVTAPLLDTPPGMHASFHSNVIIFMFLHAWLESLGLVETDSTLRRTTTYAFTVDMIAFLYTVGALGFLAANRETNSKYNAMKKQLHQQRHETTEQTLLDKTRAELSHLLSFIESDIPTFLTATGVLSITTGLLSSIYNNYYPLSSLGMFGGNVCFGLAKAELGKAFAFTPLQDAHNKQTNGKEEPIKTNGINGHKP